MKVLMGMGGLAFGAPSGVAERARENSTSDGGFEARRLVWSEGLQPGGRTGGTTEDRLVSFSERLESWASSTGAVIDQRSATPFSR